MKNSWLFLNMAKCFWGVCCFEGFNVIVVSFVCVFGIVPEVLKMLVFPNFGGFCGVACSFLFWVWKV